VILLLLFGNHVDVNDNVLDASNIDVGIDDHFISPLDIYVPRNEVFFYYTLYVPRN
jgi:hypothetical protein